MNTIEVGAVLDRGAKYLGNHPDHLSKRIAVALVLVDARLVRSPEAGILAFRMWALPEAKKHTIEDILSLADEKARA